MKVFVGGVFGRWTVLAKRESTKDGHTRSLCRCECGTERVVLHTSLLSKHSQSCGCWGRAWVGSINSKARRKDDTTVGISGIWNVYKKSAKKRGLSLSLTKKELGKLIMQDCYYCGAPPSNEFNGWRGQRDKPFLYNGIDRINTNLGYILDNCVPCCKICNYAKGKQSVTDFLEWVRRVYNRWPTNEAEG